MVYSEGAPQKRVVFYGIPTGSGTAPYKKTSNREPLECVEGWTKLNQGGRGGLSIINNSFGNEGKRIKKVSHVDELWLAS